MPNRTLPGKPRAKRVPKIELAWSAGFFDGEGTIQFAQKKFGRQLTLQVAQIDMEPLRRFKNAVRAGNIHGPYQYQETHSPKYHWNCQRFDDVKLVLRSLWPYLSSPKRKQAQAKIMKLNEYIREKERLWQIGQGRKLLKLSEFVL